MLSKPIYSITPFSLLDYPNKSACILWYVGCNMRCLYCYNPEIVLGKGNKTFSETISFLKSRQGLLDSVVFSGGECLSHKNIVQQIREVKEMGFLVKIDTNGSNTNVLKQLINEKLIDYVALDFKATNENFIKITKSDLFQPFEKSFEILLNHTVPFEIRTTYHSKLISIKKLNEMVEYLDNHNYRGNYYIQYYRNYSQTLTVLPHSDNNLEGKINISPSLNIVFR